MSDVTSTNPSTVTGTVTEASWELAARVVLPVDHDEDVLPLYVEYGRRYAGRDDRFDESVRGWGQEKGNLPPAAAAPVEGHSDDIRSRTEMTIRPGVRVSFATYVNAFPASYWRHWTTVDQVRLQIRAEGRATVHVYRSNARGASIRLHSLPIGAGEASGPETVSVDLDLVPFADGGWYWFDIVGGATPATLLEARWLVHGIPQREARLSIGVTTVDKPDYVKRIVETVAGDAELREHLDMLWIVDQGRGPVTDAPGWAEAAAALGTQLSVIPQANLGGSGGFSRGMLETLRAAKSTFHMVLDDDVTVEPEGILRALRFAALCRRPTIVGAHMFDLHNPSVLHSFGERVDPVKWVFGPVRGVHEEHNLAYAGLRETPWLHRRTDVTYTGWWMCLIPTEVLQAVGLSLPVFIKWDDAEHCLRAGAAGYPTVTFPGAHVWHVSWNDKDDTVEWQAYFHQRNLVISALLHSQLPHGGGVPRASLEWLFKHAYSMRYYANAIRLRALRDLFRGPEHLHATIGSILPELRAIAADYPDVRSRPDAEDFPAPAGEPIGPAPRLPRRSMLLPWAGKTALRHLRRVAPGSEATPQLTIPHRYALWWYLSQYDSAIVSKADGTGVAFLTRQPDTFKAQVAEGLRLHVRLYREWDSLAAAYRDALAQITSPEAWARTFGLDEAR